MKSNIVRRIKKTKYPLLASLLMSNVAFAVTNITTPSLPATLLSGGDDTFLVDTGVTVTLDNANNSTNSAIIFNADNLTFTNKGTIVADAQNATNVPLIRSTANAKNIIFINELNIDTANSPGTSNVNLIDFSNATETVTFSNIKGANISANGFGGKTIIFGSGSDVLNLGTLGSTDNAETGGAIFNNLEFNAGTSTVNVNRSFSTNGTMQAGGGAIDIVLNSAAPTTGTVFTVNNQISNVNSITLKNTENAAAAVLTTAGGGVLIPSVSGKLIILEKNTTFNANVALNNANKFKIGQLDGTLNVGAVVVDVSGSSASSDTMTIGSNGKITVANAGTFQRINAGPFVNNGTIEITGNFITTGGDASSSGTIQIANTGFLDIQDASNTFTNSGTITKNGATFGAIRLSPSARFTNTGNITSDVTAVNGAIQDSAAGTITITNSGTINNNGAANNAINLNNNAGVVANITNTGTITGGVLGSQNVTTLNLGTLNSASNSETGGSIAGAIDLGANTNILNVNRSFTTSNTISAAGDMNLYVKSNGSTNTVFTVNNNITDLLSFNAEGGKTIVSGGNLTPTAAGDDFNISGGTVQFIGVGKGSGNWELVSTGGTLQVGDGTSATGLTLATFANFTNGGIINIENNGTLTSGNGAGGPLINTGSISVKNGGVFALNNALNSTSGTLSLNSNTAGITGNSNLTFGTSGGLVIGASGGHHNGNATITLNSGATLNLNVVNAIPGELVFGNNAAPGLVLNNGSKINLNVSGNKFISSNTVFDFKSGANGAVVANPANITITTNDKLLNFALNANTLQLTATRVPLTTISKTPYAQGISNVIESFSAKDNKGFIEILAALSTIEEDKLDDAIEQLHPEYHSGSNEATTATSNNVSAISFQRLAAARKIQLSYSAGDTFKGLGLWIKGFGSNSKQKERKESKGFDASSGGLAIGFDIDFSNQFILGLNYSLMNSRVKSRHFSASRVDVEGSKFGVYGSYFFDDVFFDGSLTFGENNYERERFIKFGTLNKAYLAEHKGIQASFAGDIGYEVYVNQWLLTPKLGFIYDYTRQNGYTEREDGSFGTGLSVGSTKVRSAIGKLGIVAAKGFRKQGVDIIPNLNLGAWYDFKGERFSVVSRFNAGGDSFVTNGATPARASFHLGAGLKLVKENVTFEGNFEIEKKEKYFGTTGQINLRYKF